MILQFYNLFGKNKELNHDLFGQISCSSLQDSHKKCVDLMNTNIILEIQCRSLYELSFQCYKSKNEQEFRSWIDQQIEEKKNLYKVFYNLLFLKHKKKVFT